VLINQGLSNGTTFSQFETADTVPLKSKQQNMSLDLTQSLGTTAKATGF
jgi:hypothetical protein